MVWKAYKYLFYQNLRWNQQKDWGWGRFAAHWASVGMSFSMFFYLLSFLLLIQTIASPFFPAFLDNNIVLYIISISILIVHDLVFIRKKRYLKLIKEFENEDKIEKKKGMIIFWFYTIFSIVCFIITGFIHSIIQ